MSPRPTIVAGLLVGEALRALARHKGRTALTALSVTIGISAVVWVVAVGEAGALRAEEQLRNLGDNLVWVEAGSRNVNGVRSGSHGTVTLTIEDAEAIFAEVPRIRSLSPQMDGTVTVVSTTSNWQTRYRGVAPAYLAIRRWQIAEGEASAATAIRELLRERHHLDLEADDDFNIRAPKRSSRRSSRRAVRSPCC
jgi:putative ABC transport system permease protein